MRIDASKDFGVRTCPSCAMEVAANENRCPICGYEFPVEGVAGMLRWAAWIAVLVLAALAAGFFLAR